LATDEKCREKKEMALGSCLAAAGMRSSVIKLLMKVEKKEEMWRWDRRSHLRAMKRRLSVMTHLIKI
jgi:hypothetical protein